MRLVSGFARLENSYPLSLYVQLPLPFTGFEFPPQNLGSRSDLAGLTQASWPFQGFNAQREVTPC